MLCVPVLATHSTTILRQHSSDYPLQRDALQRAALAADTSPRPTLCTAIVRDTSVRWGPFEGLYHDTLRYLKNIDAIGTAIP